MTKSDPASQSMISTEKRSNLNLSVIPYFVGYLPGLLAVFGAYMGGWWNYSVVIFVFGLIPILDMMIGIDDWNPTIEESKDLEKRISFRLLTWFWLPFQVAIIIWACYFVTRETLSLVEWIGLITAVGFNSGEGINCAHELIHKSNRFEQTLGKIILLTVCYGHFYIEHLYGHHKKVSTKGDPATSLFGESFYTFYVRCVKDSFLDSWELEVERLKQQGLHEVSIHNQIFHFLGGSSLIALFIFVFFGVSGLVLFLFQSFVAFSLLETVNYIEHYGLERTKKSNGEYSQVTPGHSWNAGERFTNYFFFKVQRHSDHHAYSKRRYQSLRSWKTAPQLPTGYPAMIILSLIPPLWFSIMNPKVLEVRRIQKEAERLGKGLYLDPSLGYKEIMQ